MNNTNSEPRGNLWGLGLVITNDVGVMAEDVYGPAADKEDLPEVQGMAAAPRRASGLNRPRPLPSERCGMFSWTRFRMARESPEPEDEGVDVAHCGVACWTRWCPSLAPSLRGQ